MTIFRVTGKMSKRKNKEGAATTLFFCKCANIAHEYEILTKQYKLYEGELDSALNTETGFIKELGITIKQCRKLISQYNNAIEDFENITTYVSWAKLHAATGYWLAKSIYLRLRKNYIALLNFYEGFKLTGIR